MPGVLQTIALHRPPPPRNQTDIETIPELKVWQGFSFEMVLLNLGLGEK
jgi:hypothetical protein